MSSGDMPIVDIEGNRPPFPLLIAFSVLGPLSIHLILPSLPDLQRAFSADYVTIQFLISVFVVTFGFSQIFVGMLADRFGQRKILLAGLALYALASALCAFTSSIDSLIALRAIQGIGICAGTVIARSVVRLWYNEAESTRILGYLAIGVSVGPMVAPMIGGAIFELSGWEGLFLSMALAGAFSLLLALPFSFDRIDAEMPVVRNIFADVGRLLRRRTFLLYWSTVSLNAGVVLSFIIGAPYIGIRTFGLTPTAFGIWFGMGAVGYAAGNFVAGMISTRVSREAAVFAGTLAVAACVFAMIALFQLGMASAPPIFLAFAGIMAASGFIMPNSYAGAMSSDPTTAGSASGFLGFGQYVNGAVFSAIGTLLMEAYAAPVLLTVVMACSAIGGIAVAVLLLRGHRA